VRTLLHLQPSRFRAAAAGPAARQARTWLLPTGDGSTQHIFPPVRFNLVMLIDVSRIMYASDIMDLDNCLHVRFITHRKVELGIPKGLIKGGWSQFSKGIINMEMHLT
jgi:hypothetical protein